MTKVWVDAGCNNAVVKHGAALSIDVEAVARDKEQKGFVVQPIRWRVEQTFGITSPDEVGQYLRPKPPAAA
ncbi:hypothetical protein [Streptomyces sp. NRRL S-495]|uniref:hypothetical protein n=1 Tax=Streptomyces sp. NRRL S-495 TaxID=1609133 RepID=UPI0005F90B55|nr:hypothetical protein [Streptomyces sp. NRRL S-495]KJY29877.1 hypothetical protein VR45_28985 [Streptomyces sp. NRRL S-495]